MTPANWRQWAAQQRPPQGPGSGGEEEDRSEFEAEFKVEYLKWNFREWPKLDLDQKASFMPW